MIETNVETEQQVTHARTNTSTNDVDRRVLRRFQPSEALPDVMQVWDSTQELATSRARLLLAAIDDLTPNCVDDLALERVFVERELDAHGCLAGTKVPLLLLACSEALPEPPVTVLSDVDLTL